MTVKVVRNAPEPVVPPPATYDITGLTYAQAAFIRDLLGLVADSGRTGVQPIYAALYNSLPGTGEDFEFTGEVSPVAKRLTVVHACPLG